MSAGLGGLLVGQSAALPPLVADRTVYCNSATGSDTTGDGSSAAPWQTLARAWSDRLTFGELRAKYIVQLIGVGPYTMPVMGASACGVGGYFIVQGDTAVDVAIASGTFTGDLNTTTYVLPTSSGLGTDTLKTYFLEITSGNCSGVRTNIVINTDTGITIPFRSWRTTLGAVANGDTFRVFAPGTVINLPAPASGGLDAGCLDWSGGTLFSASTPPRHVFYNVQLTGSKLAVRSSCLGLCGVRSSLTSAVWVTDSSRVLLGGGANGSLLGVGADSATNKLLACGLVETVSGPLIAHSSSTVQGVGVFVGAVTLGSGSFVVLGGRYEGGFFVNGGSLEAFSGSNSYMRLQGPVSLSYRSRALLYSGAGAAAKVVCASTAGDCFALNGDALLYFENAGASGGTTAAGGYAVKLTESRAVLKGAFVLTGGTASADVKTSVAAAIANSFFSAANVYAADLGGAETVVRI